MKLDECTKEHELALNCLQGTPISENVLRIETKPSTAMFENPELLSRSLQEFSMNAQASNRDKQPSACSIFINGKPFGYLGPAISFEKIRLAKHSWDSVHTQVFYMLKK